MPKTQALCRWALEKVLRFRLEERVEKPRKFVVALAPHTSNWDFLIGILASYASGFPCNFIMKREWFFWPLGGLMRRLGGIPVRRDRHSNLVRQLAEEARRSDTFALCITPEGTRKRRTRWKTGFYYIALEADLPVLLYGLDYSRRLISCTKMMRPTGDIDSEMREIKQYFSDFRAKHPTRFATGL
ncbi:MAG: 1-acyl-sn-glycerol-3-phosphate acyltransferase [Prevotellaceae bacterium]|nr:1-acyl-sn-glycerol-3-phosphate acyltransferase [Prevotellaceae bacterium]